MKKFSKITKQKVGKEPIVKVEKTADDYIKKNLYTLMEDFLSIKSYGAVDKNNGTYKIGGKDMFVNAVVDMLEEITNSNNKKLLESLKSEVNDWEAIDEKIKSLNQSKVNLKSRKSFDDLIRLYSNDEDFLVEISENKINRINNKEKLSDYKKLLESVSLKEKTKLNLDGLIEKRLKSI